MPGGLHWGSGFWEQKERIAKVPHAPDLQNPAHDTSPGHISLKSLMRSNSESWRCKSWRKSGSGRIFSPKEYFSGVRDSFFSQEQVIG